MTIYETVKAAISVKQADEHYVLKVNRNGMVCCPFHNDRHPSLKLNEEYFFCFGCGAKGDVIDFVARLFDLSGYEAAQKLVVLWSSVFVTLVAKNYWIVAWRLSELSAFINGASHCCTAMPLSKPATSGFR